MPDKFPDPDPRSEGVTPNRPPPPRPQKPARDDWEGDDHADFRREEGDATGGLIPYKNPNALIGYYCGVFSLIPIVGLILGPIALVLGMKGLSYVKKHPTAKGTGHAVTALVLGGLSSLGHFGCILLAVVGIIASRSR